MNPSSAVLCFFFFLSFLELDLETSFTTSLSAISLSGPKILSRVSLYFACRSSIVIADFSLARFESVGDATPAAGWLSYPVSEPSFEGAIEPSVVSAPDPFAWQTLPSPARRMIFIVGWLDGALSPGAGAATRVLNGVGLVELAMVLE